MEEGETTELDYFSNLNSGDKSIRLNAIKGILKRLKQESRNNPQNAYFICKRLIRGLGGSNLHFRQGCFACMVGYLSLLPPDFNINIFETLIETELHPAVSRSKQENGEAYLGQILAYGALVISNLISASSEEVQKTIFDKLFKLGQKRSYLHYASFIFLTELLKRSENEFIPDCFIENLANLNEDPLSKLNYLLTLENKSFKTSTIRKVLGTKSFFDLANITKYTSCLKRYKALQFMDNTFIDDFITSAYNHPNFFLSFWSSIIDQRHLKSGGPNVKKFSSNDDVLILQLCSCFLKTCAKNNNWALINSMWDQKLLSLLLRNIRNNKKLVQSLLNDFCISIKPASEDIKLNILKLTLFDRGILNFDVLTGSKTILSLTNSLSFNGLKELAKSYKAVIENKRDIIDFDLKNKGILMSLNYFTKLISNSACYEEIPWRISQLSYLLKLGYFKQKDIHLNRDLINHVQEAFLTSLGHRFPNLESFQKVLNELFLKLNKLLNSSRDDALIKLNDEMFDAWKKSFLLNKEMTEYLQREHKEVIIILKIILQYMSLLILKEPSTAVINIKDLDSIFHEIIDGNESIWIEVLTDLFLNLLSKPNYHHRHLIRCIFKSLCPHLTPESFNQVVEVLELSYDPRDIMEHNGEIKSDESSSDNDSDDSNHDSEIEEDNDIKISANEKLRFDLRNVLAAESDIESVDLDNMDEEEGKRLNEILGNVFKSNMRRKRSNKLSKYQNQLTHFRTRVMDLIEICTEVVLPFSYWLKVALPIIDLYGSTIGQKQLDSLRTRIKCCIKKLNSSKVSLENSCTEEAVVVLKDLFNKLSKSSGVYSDMKTELCCMIKFILKSSKPFSKGLKQKPLSNNELFQLFKSHLEDFFSSNYNIPVILFNSVISMGWDGILTLFPYFIGTIFNDNIKMHKRIQGIKMVETFFKTPQYFDGHLQNYYETYLTSSSEMFYNSIVEAINKMCDNKDSSFKFYSELWSLLVVIFSRQTKKDAFPEILNQSRLKDFLSLKLQELPITKGQYKQSFKKLCNFLTIHIDTKGENLNVTNNNFEEVRLKKNLNKRKKNDKLYEGIKKKAKRFKSNKVELVK